MHKFINKGAKQALYSIVSEITSQLVAQHEGYRAHEYEQKVTETVKKIWNSMLKIGGCAAVLSGLGPIYAPAKDLLTANTTSDKEHSLQSLYPRQREAVKSLKAFLSEYAEVINNKQIVVIVDELDRCRPNYAIELLETIKHFFEMPGYMFVVATDTEQLGHSIKAIYGSDFNGQEYLSRFFIRSAKLPEPDKLTFSKYLVESSQIGQILEELQLPLKLEKETPFEHISNILACIGTIYQLSLRRMEQLFAKFESIISYIGTNTYCDCHLMLQLVCEHDHPEYMYSYQEKKLSKRDIVDEKLVAKYQQKRSYGKEGSAGYAKKIRKESTDYLYIADLFAYIFILHSASAGVKSATIDDTQWRKLNQVAPINEPEAFVTVGYYKLFTEKAPLNTMQFEDYFRYVELAANFE
ncbi:hypothetical protein CWC22_023935 [Pseudoalteromonas rubra]|uniref:KAP NTPase domain-containing protein n=1 Tax=Pseudoalteromonas rubra TaxID=43658 RepID=A0A5S3UTA3_9GAMM|nr:hypothetical protein CWC22_023935 [Pseudoalteromonas rubra]